jgi:very-short-patch-repair endonuclease
MIHSTKRKRVQPWKLERAKELRHNATASEKALWEMLRARRLGVKFRRQHIALGWILDFYCPEVGLAVELDGSRHDHSGDAVRDAAISKLGIRTLRIASVDVFINPGSVISRIRSAVASGATGAKAWCQK